ncbi:MAG: ABC transporter permease [Lachnospiraceae bacterium]|nr:ABC transporter permease [Lachnospiraceae bacterium]
MKRTMEFAKRNLIELSRDVLSYIFCVAFPIVMLIVMSVVNESIPPQAGMTTFRIDNLSAGIIIFGHAFVMLFTAILVSTDKSTSFLMRLYSSPMKSSDFTNGYIIPMLLIALLQALSTIVASVVIAGISGYELKLPGLLLMLLTSLPSALMFISIGMIFGTLFNEKAAPGMCSVIISVGSFLGGIFFDAEGVGGVIYRICRCLPFIYCTKLSRSSVKLEFGKESFILPLVVVSAVAVVLMFLATSVFKSRMNADR